MVNGCRTLCLIRFLSPIEARKEGPCSSPALSPASASPAHMEKLSGQFNLDRVLLRKTFFTVNFFFPPPFHPPLFFFSSLPALIEFCKPLISFFFVGMHAAYANTSLSYQPPWLKPSNLNVTKSCALPC